MAADSSHSRSAAGHVSLSLSTNDAGEGKRIFEMLSAGGTVTMPYQATFWGADFGMLTDRFGVDWMVNSDNASA